MIGYTIWLVVWLPFSIFPYIGLLIIPIDELIFFRGLAGWPNHQPAMVYHHLTGPWPWASPPPVVVGRDGAAWHRTIQLLGRRQRLPLSEPERKTSWRSRTSPAVHLQLFAPSTSSTWIDLNRRTFHRTWEIFLPLGIHWVNGSTRGSNAGWQMLTSHKDWLVFLKSVQPAWPSCSSPPRNLFRIVWIE